MIQSGEIGKLGEEDRNAEMAGIYEERTKSVKIKIPLDVVPSARSKMPFEGALVNRPSSRGGRGKTSHPGEGTLRFFLFISGNRRCCVSLGARHYFASGEIMCILPGCHF